MKNVQHERPTAGLYKKYQVLNRTTGEEVQEDYFILKPINDQAARAALEKYAAITNNEQLEQDIHAWLQSLPAFVECDWCGEPADLLSHPHMFDPAIGKKICEHCWEHDREVYRGSYGEDIGEFKPITAQKEDHRRKLKIGDLVEVEEPFFWYGEERYEVGQRFVIEAQHVSHNFEAWVKVIE